ncbi:MAG: peptide-methionine (S)-S-oxide reductase MsrA [Myxococcota bacterium]
MAPEPEPGLEVATFAGGCFWCMEPPFEKLSGVKAVVSGYTGGKEPAPTYKQVGYGRTGHAEAVRVYFDPDFVTYEELLDTFWRSIDPTDAGGQFADRGAHYRTAIFVHDEMQKAAADASKSKLSASKKFEAAIVTPVESVGPFWVAEEYHQDYYKKNPGHYQRYRRGSGRAGFLEKHWGKKSS